MCRASPPARWAPSSTRSARAACPRARSAGWVAGSTSAWARSWAAPKYVNVVVIAAAGVNTEGQREVLGLKVGASEAEPFWTEFRRSLNRRGLRGVKLVISDSQEGIKVTPYPRCSRPPGSVAERTFMRNALAHAGKTQRRRVSAAIGTVFVPDSADAASARWRSAADQLRGKFSKLGALMDEAEKTCSRS